MNSHIFNFVECGQSMSKNVLVTGGITVTNSDRWDNSELMYIKVYNINPIAVASENDKILH